MDLPVPFQEMASSLDVHAIVAALYILMARADTNPASTHFKQKMVRQRAGWCSVRQENEGGTRRFPLVSRTVVCWVRPSAEAFGHHQPVLSGDLIAHYLGVDFELTRTVTLIDEPYFSRYQRGELGHEDLELLIRSQFNVVRELRMTLSVRKPVTP